MNRPAREHGFSLIETLVALAVIAAMAGMLFETISANASFAGSLAKRREAIMLAQSLLAQASITAGPGELVDSGQVRGLGWRVARKRLAGEARDTIVPLEELQIDVIDSATGHRLTRVQTLRLAR